MAATTLLAGAGALAATDTTFDVAAAAFAGNTLLTATLSQFQPAAAALSGSGLVLAAAWQAQTAVASLSRRRFIDWRRLTRLQRPALTSRRRRRYSPVSAACRSLRCGRSRPRVCSLARVLSAPSPQFAAHADATLASAAALNAGSAQLMAGATCWRPSVRSAPHCRRSNRFAALLGAQASISVAALLRMPLGTVDLGAAGLLLAAADISAALKRGKVTPSDRLACQISVADQLAESVTPDDGALAAAAAAWRQEVLQ